MANSSVTIKFTGTYLAWIAKKSPAYGKARLTLDGVDQGTVNLYSANELWERKIRDKTVASGSYTLVITCTGTKRTTATNCNTRWTPLTSWARSTNRGSF